MIPEYALLYLDITQCMEQNSILQSAQGSWFRGTVRLEVPIQTETRAVGGAQHLQFVSYEKSVPDI